jgi:hypothetical protein
MPIDRDHDLLSIETDSKIKHTVNVTARPNFASVDQCVKCRLDDRLTELKPVSCLIQLALTVSRDQPVQDTLLNRLRGPDQLQLRSI